MPPTMNRKGVSPLSVPLVLIVCFVTAVALGCYALVFLRALLVNDKGADLARTAAKGAHTLDRLLFERYEDIRVFATDRMLLDGRQEEKRNRLQQYKDLYGYYSWIGTTDAVGQVTAATDSPASQTNTIPADVGSRRLRSVETVRRTRRVHLEVVGGPAENGDATAVEFFAPLEDAQREFRGVVISAMPIEHFWTKKMPKPKLMPSTGFSWTVTAAFSSRSIDYFHHGPGCNPLRSGGPSRAAREAALSKNCRNLTAILL
jgi:hypothetical protein